MDFIEKINTTLRPKVSKDSIQVLDLFSGCGGLSLGFEANGFVTYGYEMVEAACETYNSNLKGFCENIKLSASDNFPKSDIVIGGPPCQPFSVGGKQKGLNDSRDGFPIFIRAIKEAKPKIFLFENVRGLLYKNKWYLEEIICELGQLGFQLDIHLINAKDYGVPQNRERLFVIGHHGGFSFPKKDSRYTTAGEALGDLAFQVSEESKFLTASMDKYIAKYEKASKCVNPRDLYLDRPARTLTCRNLAGATGDMHRIKLPDGRRRRVTTKEAARLQSFPDHFNFKGNETAIFNQIGNAVPPLLAYKIAKEIKIYLNNYNNDELKVNNSKKYIVSKQLALV